MALIRFNNEQKLVQDQVKKFVIQEIEPISSDIERQEKIPDGIFKKLTDLGLLCPILPVEYGGAGMDITSLCIIIEELSKSCASLGLVIAVNNALAGFSLIEYGEGKQKAYLERLSKGEIAGFDYGTGETNILQSNPLKITGNRDFLLNGDIAGYILLTIKSENISGLYIIEKLNYRVRKVSSMGVRSSGISEMTFDALELPDNTCLLCGNNFEMKMADVYNLFNLCLSAIGLGISQASLDASLKYSKERCQFGKPICEFPMVQEMLAEMKIKIEATRNLVYDAAGRFDTGKEYALTSDIAFVTSANTAVYCGIKSVQIFGGYGYTKDYPVERYLRDAKTLQVIGQDTFSIKEKIARAIL